MMLALLTRIAESGPGVPTLLVLLGAVVAAVATAFAQIISIRAERRRELTFAERVDRAVKALHEATRVVDELEVEIASRQRAVERLQDQQELLELDPSEVAAVSHVLQGDAKREGRRSLWTSVGASALFFLAGVGVTLLVQ